VVVLVNMDEADAGELAGELFKLVFAAAPASKN
jgi:hypothetical protein